MLETNTCDLRGYRSNYFLLTLYFVFLAILGCLQDLALDPRLNPDELASLDDYFSAFNYFYFVFNVYLYLGQGKVSDIVGETEKYIPDLTEKPLSIIIIGYDLGCVAKVWPTWIFLHSFPPCDFLR